MSTGKLLMGISICAALSACTMPTITGPNSVQNTSSASSVMDDVETQSGELEYGDSEAPASQGPIVPVTHRTELIERVMENGNLSIGSENAPIEVTLFTNHSCAYCKTFTDEQLDHFLDNFVATGKVRLFIALLNIKKYPQSQLQEKGFICSALQQKGLAGHKALFRFNLDDKKSFASFLTQVSLDAKTFGKCMEAPETLNMVKLMEQGASDRNISLVPTIIINGEKHEGLMDYRELRSLLIQGLTK